jgi:outer membrane protein
MNHSSLIIKHSSLKNCDSPENHCAALQKCLFLYRQLNNVYLLKTVFMRYFKTILLFSLALWLPFVGIGQTSAVLDEYIKTGLTNNLALQQQNTNLEKSTVALQQAKSLFMPTVSFNANYTLAAGGRRIAFPIGDILNPVYTNLNGLNEALRTGAPRYPTDVQNVNEQFLPNNFHETKIKFAYPLYNTDLRYNRDIQTHQTTSKAAQRDAYEQALKYQITSAYLQYLQAIDGEKVWATAKNTLLELKRFNESLVRNNVATREVVAIADYEISKVDHEIFSLKSTQNTARAYFNFLLNRDLQADVVADTALLRATLPVYNRAVVIEQALDNRKEFAALRAGMEAAASAVRLHEANRKIPSAYVGGEFGFQGFGYNLGDRQAYALVQVGVKYDIFNGGLTKHKITAAKLESVQLNTQLTETQQKIALQVTSALNSFENARNAWMTAQTGLKAAEETFRIINNKYRAGQALLVEYLDAQNRVNTARLQIALAWGMVLIEHTALRQAAGF